MPYNPFSHLPLVQAVLIPVADVSLRPAFSYPCAVFQACILISVPDVSDLRSHMCSRYFRPAFSYLCPVFQTCVLTYARCFRPAFSYLCPMFQTCVLRCVAGVSDLRSNMCSRCFRLAFSYPCPVFQTRVLIPMPGVSDPRSHTYARCFRPAVHAGAASDPARQGGHPAVQPVRGGGALHVSGRLHAGGAAGQSVSGGRDLERR